MGQTTINSLCWPLPQWFIGQTFFNGPFTALLLDASGEKAAYIVHAPKTGTLSKVGFRFGTVTTPQDIKVSFQDISNTDGNADGTADQYRVVTSPTSNTWTTTGIISSDGTDGGVKRSVTKGQMFAVVFEFNSTAGNLNISAIGAYYWAGYVRHYTSSWAQPSFSIPNMLLEYDDGSYAYSQDLWAMSTSSYHYIGTGETIDEAGMRFKTPVHMKVSGGMFDGYWINGNAKIKLYDANNTLLATGVGYDGTTSTDTIDKDIGTTGNWWRPFYFDTEVLLQPDTVYRVTALATTAGQSYVLNMSVPTNAAFGQFQSIECYSTTRKSAGAWTDTTTTMPFVTLFVTQVHDGREPTSGMGI